MGVYDAMPLLNVQVFISGCMLSEQNCFCFQVLA